MACVFSWSVPDYTFFLSRWNAIYFRPIAQRLLFPSGLVQNWGMFIETGEKWSETTLRLVANTPEGLVQELDFPRIEKMSLVKRFFFQKFRKLVECSFIPGFFKNHSYQGICKYYRNNFFPNAAFQSLEIWEDVKVFHRADEGVRYATSSRKVSNCP